MSARYSGIAFRSASNEPFKRPAEELAACVCEGQVAAIEREIAFESADHQRRKREFIKSDPTRSAQPIRDCDCLRASI